MAYIDRDEPREYPYQGVFRRKNIDTSVPLNQRTDNPIDILSTVCDITPSTHSMSGILATADYAVYFPVGKSESVLVKRGDTFEADFCGVNVKGNVIGVFPSQLDGCTVYVKVIDA